MSTATQETEATTVTHDEWTVPTNLEDEDGWINFVPKPDEKLPIAPYKNDWDERPVDAQDPDNTTSYRRAMVGWRWGDYGLGFVLPNRNDHPNSSAVLIDGDGVLNQDNGTLRMHPFFHDLIQRAESFADVSWSFGGSHLVGIAPDGLPDGIAKIEASLPEHPDFPNATVEVYDGGRFVAMSGRHIHGTPAEARNIQPIVDELVEQFGGESGTDSDPSGHVTGVSREDVPERIVELARQQNLALDGRNDEKVAAIWNDIREFYGRYEITNRARHYLNDLFNAEAKTLFCSVAEPSRGG